MIIDIWNMTGKYWYLFLAGYCFLLSIFIIKISWNICYSNLGTSQTTKGPSTSHYSSNIFPGYGLLNAWVEKTSMNFLFILSYLKQYFINECYKDTVKIHRYIALYKSLNCELNTTKLKKNIFKFLV